MSNAAATSLRERVRGMWQIPALLAAIALFAGSILRLRSVQVFYPVEAYLAQLAARVEDGHYSSAIAYGGRLQQRDDLTPADRAAVHLQLARAYYLRAQTEKQATPESAAVVHAEYEAAFAGGAPRVAEDLVRWGQAHLWRAESNEALARFEEALGIAAPPALDIRRRIVELCLTALETPPADVLPMLDAFIADAAPDVEAMLWGVATKVDLLAQEGRNAEAATMLASLRDRFEPSASYGDYRYLVALTSYRSGDYDSAEGQLRDLRNALTETSELYAMTGWLLGRVVLSDGRPQRPEEALSFFRDVIDAVPRGAYATASRLGVAEACAALGRYEESLSQFRRVMDLRSQDEPVRVSPLLDPAAIRTSITAIGETLRHEGDMEPALQYYELASSLIGANDEPRWAQYLEILGDLRAGLARSLREKVRKTSGDEPVSDAQRERWESDARYLLIEAGENFLKLAQLAMLNESQAADAVRRAANLFDEGGATRRTISTLEQFLTERPDNERIPQGLLRLGQARQALGMYSEAVEAFQENLRRFPRTPDAGSGLIPLARCYMALGPEYSDQAVETLAIILEDSPVFTPQAPEFRDALFLLGDLHHAEGRFEPCITVLEEALERYPSDERALRCRFLLADSYRQSALALKRESDDPKAAADRPRMRGESASRLKQAADLFARWVEDTARGVEPAQIAEPAEDLEALLAKHARLYHADCLFELGRFPEALAGYETAAFILRNEPSALSAYVQIVNCRLSMGQSAEARTAMRRARYLLQTMPETAFEGPSVGQSRREWERYMDWLEGAELF